MPDEISKDTFEHLVELAALELEPEDADYLHRELNNQLASINTLAQIPLDDSVKPAAHGVSYPPENTPAIREDESIDCEEREAILEQAPELEDGYIVVPEIPQEELD